MDKLKFAIIAIAIIIVFVIIALVLILTNFNGDSGLGEDGYVTPEEYEINIDLTDKQVKYVDNRNEYYAVEKCIKQYLKAILNQNAEEIYNYLDKEFINKNNINSGNVLLNIDENGKFSGEEILLSIDEMLTVKNENDLRVYFIYGNIGSTYDSINQEFNVMVRMDKTNDTFSILPYKYMRDNQYLNLKIYDAVTKEFTSIEKNQYNSYNYINIKDEEMVANYLSNYIDQVLYNTNKAYLLLDEEYKAKRFPTFEDFSNYMQNREFTYIKNFNVKKYDGYTIYQCEDVYGARYIFKETAIMQYTAQLDDYTLDNELFNENYQKATSMNKGLLNIQKFFEMINTQDYTSAYNVLDSNFKQNYFPTQLDFENYMKSHVFKYNIIENGDYSDEISNIHSYTVVLTDATWEDERQIEFSIVMRLLEGTNFVMSFQVN